jgi:hypothetical protein
VNPITAAARLINPALPYKAADIENNGAPEAGAEKG